MERRSLNNRIEISRVFIFAFVVAVFVGGCGTTTKRVATEQLLISDAVDQAISQFDFSPLAGKKIFVDTGFMKSVKGVGSVNAEYIVSSMRQQLTAFRCLIQEDRNKAEIIVEPRVGALGTDGHEVVYGIPQTSGIVSAASILSNSAVPPIPEVSFGKSNAHSGIAKVIVFAYDRETREPIWQSGIAKAESTSRNTWVFGAGPFQKGSIHEGTRFAGQKLPPHPQLNRFVWDPRNATYQPAITDTVSETINYGQEHVFARVASADVLNESPPPTAPETSPTAKPEPNPTPPSPTAEKTQPLEPIATPATNAPGTDNYQGSKTR